MLCAQVHLTLPAWLQQADLEQRGYADADARMALAIELARRNIEHGSGGPFGAALLPATGACWASASIASRP
jgi:hypothetical protein